MLASTERDAKDFKWHHGQSYVWGVSIIDLHERKKSTQLTGYLWPRCDGCARSSSGSLAKLGRYPSSLRPHLFGFSRLPGDGEVVRMKRRRFQQVLESTMFRSIARLLERNNTRHPWSRRWRASTGSFPTSCRLTRFSSTQQWAMMGGHRRRTLLPAAAIH
jgi:hypothetical protein